MYDFKSLFALLDEKPIVSSVLEVAKDCSHEMQRETVCGEHQSTMETDLHWFASEIFRQGSPLSPCRDPGGSNEWGAIPNMVYEILMCKKMCELKNVTPVFYSEVLSEVSKQIVEELELKSSPTANECNIFLQDCTINVATVLVSRATFTLFRVNHNVARALYYHTGNVEHDMVLPHYDVGPRPSLLVCNSRFGPSETFPLYPKVRWYLARMSRIRKGEMCLSCCKLVHLAQEALGWE